MLTLQKISQTLVLSPDYGVKMILMVAVTTEVHCEYSVLRMGVYIPTSGKPSRTLTEKVCNLLKSDLTWLANARF